MTFPALTAAATAPAAGGASVHVSPAMWAGLGVLVAVMIVVDFMVFGRGRRQVTVRESAIWSIGWLFVAIGFGAVLWTWQGSQAGSEYFAGYLLERSLSLDNIFVFAVIFSYFAVPLAVQPRVLAWGIALALVLRLVFILVGAALLANFHATFYLFGAVLLYTAWKLYHHDDTGIEPEHNPALRLLRRRVPMTADYRGRRLTVRDAGRRLATPLMAVFLVVATTDVIFAVDSIPAIFAITQDAFIVFAANAFALIGLRALYFTLVGAMDRFVYLSYGLAVILAFIGAKMLLIDVWHPPIWLSLVVIVGVLVVTALLSLRAEPHRPQVVDDHALPVGPERGEGDEPESPAGGDVDAAEREPALSGGSRGD
jgi:tellurite resistance protein TerC